MDANSREWERERRLILQLFGFDSFGPQAGHSWLEFAGDLMRLLDRYLLRELLIPFGYCLAGFLLFWVFSDVMGEIGTFQKYKLQALDIAYYYAIKLPEWLVFPIVPAAWLLAIL